MNTNQKINQSQQTKRQREQLLEEAVRICNSMQPGGNYRSNPAAMGVVTGTIRKELGHGSKKEDLEIGRALHLKFLQFIYSREFTTTKIDVPGGFKPHEAMGMLVWAQPAKITENSPWTCARRVKLAVRAFEIEKLGQLELSMQVLGENNDNNDE